MPPTSSPAKTAIDQDAKSGTGPQAGFLENFAALALVGAAGGPKGSRPIVVHEALGMAVFDVGGGTFVNDADGDLQIVLAGDDGPIRIRGQVPIDEVIEVRGNSAGFGNAHRIRHRIGRDLSIDSRADAHE